jgi:hypothetical protein
MLNAIYVENGISVVITLNIRRLEAKKTLQSNGYAEILLINTT